jgi:hypothetical protein
MSKRYIDLNSTYRNRKAYPNVCDFVVEMNPILLQSSSNAQDPVLLAFPFETNQLQGGSTFTQIVLSVEASNILDYYVGNWIEINGFFRQVTNYDPTLKVATVSPGFPVAYPALTIYTIRYELPALRDFTGGVAANTNQIVLNAGASSVDDFYKNMWVFVPGPTPTSSYQWFRILAYNGTTKVATVSGNFAAIIGAGVVFEILRFSYDNVKALKYFGTDTGTNNPVCYTLNLVNLIVPNLPIEDGYHGTLQNYPFLYVAIFSEKGYTYNNVLISNTPASDYALFKVPISYLQDTDFLTLGYAGMAPIASFRVNDDLRLRILLPNGEVLKFVIGTSFPDYGFPIPPDNSKQIQAVFEVSK